MIVAGATDVGLWITKQLRTLPKIIHIGRPRASTKLPTRRHLSLVLPSPTPSANASRSIDPDIGELIRRLGSKQVRAAGTIGGNIANGSPIGDMPPR